MWLLVRRSPDLAPIDILDAWKGPAPAAPGPPIDRAHARIAATVLNAEGELVHTDLWPERAAVFVDHDGSRRGDLTGGRISSGEDLRVVWVPLEARGYLALKCYDEREAEAGAALFCDPGAAPDWPIPGFEGQEVRRIPLVDVPHGRTQNGEIVGPAKLIHNGSTPERSFNVVILGDGFQRGELDMFHACAKNLALDFVRRSPFEGYSSSIRIWALGAASTDSGVTNCPRTGVEKRTYYNVEGAFGATWPGYCGTHTQGVIERALLSEGLPSPIHLVIMLVNSAIYGGRGDPNHRIVYVPIQGRDSELLDLTLHEAGHVFGLTDEYLGEGPTDGIPYPNLATEAQRQTGGRAVSWWDLARDFEKDGGHFRAVHLVGDPTHPKTGKPVIRGGIEKMLGMYWGCSFVDTGIDLGIEDRDQYTDVRGGHYYRPMAECRMRWVDAPFCRVCDRHIAKAIARAAGLPAP